LCYRSFWRHAEEKLAAKDPSRMPVGTLLMRTFPQWTLRQEETYMLTLGNKVEIAIVRR
jgi:hypothetical protein